MNTKRLVSIVTGLIVTATLMLAPCAPAKETNGIDIVEDRPISSEVILAQELVHAK